MKHKWKNEISNPGLSVSLTSQRTENTMAWRQARRQTQEVYLREPISASEKHLTRLVRRGLIQAKREGKACVKDTDYQYQGGCDCGTETSENGMLSARWQFLQTHWPEKEGEDPEGVACQEFPGGRICMHSSQGRMARLPGCTATIRPSPFRYPCHVTSSLQCVLVSTFPSLFNYYPLLRVQLAALSLTQSWTEWWEQQILQNHQQRP